MKIRDVDWYFFSSSVPLILPKTVGMSISSVYNLHYPMPPTVLTDYSACPCQHLARIGVSETTNQPKFTKMLSTMVIEKGLEVCCTYSWFISCNNLGPARLLWCSKMWVLQSWNLGLCMQYIRPCRHHSQSNHGREKRCDPCSIVGVELTEFIVWSDLFWL